MNFLIYNNFLSSTVKFCLNASTNDGLLFIEIQSFVHTGSIVGVDSISEGSSLTLKVRILQDSTHYYNISFMSSCSHAYCIVQNYCGTKLPL